MALIEIDIEKKVNSYSRESRKQFGSVTSDGYSDSDSNSDFENDLVLQTRRDCHFAMTPSRVLNLRNRRRLMS